MENSSCVLASRKSLQLIAQYVTACMRAHLREAIAFNSRLSILKVAFEVRYFEQFQLFLIVLETMLNKNHHEIISHTLIT